MSKKKETPFARFLSSVEGFIVARFGTGEDIGVTIVAGDPSKTKWHTDRVVALTEHEAGMYRREYDQEVRENRLKERTEAEYLAFVKASEANDPGPKPRQTETEKKPE